MKTLILYGSPTKLTNAHKLATNPRGPFKQPPYYVRVKVCPGEPSDLQALDRARPMKGETVLNTVEI